MKPNIPRPPSSLGSASVGSRSHTPPPRHSSRDLYNQQQQPPPPQSVWKTVRWILLGFGVGAATTAMFHSVNMPHIRVELEYADAPALHHIQQHGGSSYGNGKLIFSTGAAGTNQIMNKLEELHSRNNQNDKDKEDGNKDTDDDTDDGLNQEDDDTVKKEREKVQQALKEEDHPNDAQDVEDAANANSKDDAAEADKAKKEEEAEYKPSADEPDFTNPGPPPKLAQGEAFAACILIKDDNHWLIEWLAYHYHVMPLRYLIVAIDPDSKTSPIPILKRWKAKKLMTISIWGDDMFMPTTIKANPKSFDNNTELMMHRVRQNNFYFKCMRTFKQRNREWLMLIDTDEYIVTNYASGLYYNLTKQIPITQPGNVLKFIKQHHSITGENHTCSYMPRYMFGTKETSPEMVQRHVFKYPNLDGMDFLTQRFLYRNPRRMHNGKNLINIQKLPQIKMYTSVHYVSSYCPDPDTMRTVNHVKKALVRVHHYLGREDQYFFRSDPRQTKTKPPLNITDGGTDGGTDGSTALTTTNTTAATAANKKPKATSHAYFTRGQSRYDNLNKRSNYPDQGARAWIRGFIDQVGIETAEYLLKGVGQVGYVGEPNEI